MNNSVLVIGSIAYDEVETPFGKREKALGGSAVFFSIAASLFTKVKLVGVAGEDFSNSTILMLKEKGINTDGLEIAPGKTFRWGGKYHDDINFRDTLYTDLNVFADFKPSIPDHYKDTPYVFLGNIQPSLQMDVINQLNKPKFTALDTMNLWINTAKDELQEVIQKIDLLMINDSELRELSGELNLLKGLKYLHQQGLTYIVVKKGEHGAYLSYLPNDNERSELFYVPSFPVWEPKDPTGAGDSFAGGFMGYLASQDNINIKTIKNALIHGSIMGAFCVEDFSIDALTNIDKNKISHRYNILKNLVLV